MHIQQNKYINKELIAFLNGKIIDGISITAGNSPKNAGVKKQVIRVVFNIAGVANSQKPSFDININKYEVGKANLAVLDKPNQRLDEVMQLIMAFKNQQHGGRRVKYNKKRVTHKKRTRRIRRKHSRRN
jgi:hypothetical protein